ncbi:MAG: DegV family protein [Clostridia bacterium]|nr:DegV family protein [Clostridia bacterium]
MRKYLITTENTTDFPEEYIKQHDLRIVGLTYSIDDVTYGVEGSPAHPSNMFYKLMRDGKTPKTTQVNPDGAKKFFEEILKEGYNILHIAFSSGLSGTYNSMVIAAEELREEYPDSKIIVIDSLCASLGEGLLVDFALELQAEGKTMDEVAAIVEYEKLSFSHIFTVEDLVYLYRGGRVSKTSMVLGTMLGIKPMLHVDNIGKLVPESKVRGRKASLDTLVKTMVSRMDKEKTKKFFISHGDCFEEAQYLAEKIKEATGITDYLIGNIGPVIGSHSGPGTMAVFFRGKR